MLASLTPAASLNHDSRPLGILRFHHPGTCSNVGLPLDRPLFAALSFDWAIFLKYGAFSPRNIVNAFFTDL